jgi:hypothetical protein
MRAIAASKIGTSGPSRRRQANDEISDTADWRRRRPASLGDQRHGHASMPALNRLCDQALSNPQIAGLAKPAIDALRVRLQLLAQA